MADALRRFVDWVSAYTLAPPGAVLRMAMSVPSALEAPKTEIVYRAARRVEGDDAALKLTNARRRVLEQLKDGPALPAAELAHLAGVGTSVIKTMASIGLLEGVERTMRRSFAQPDGLRQGPELSPEQAIAAQGLVDKVSGAQLSRRRCSMACPVPARRRSISKPSPRRWHRAGRCWCCCPRSR